MEDQAEHTENLMMSDVTDRFREQGEKSGAIALTDELRQEKALISLAITVVDSILMIALFVCILLSR